MREKRMIVGIGLTLLHGSIELLLFFPLILCIAAFVVPELSIWQWAGTLPLCYVAGYAANRYFSFSRFYSLLIAVLLLGAANATICFPQSYHAYWLLPLACVCVFRGTKLVTVPWRVYFPVTLYMIGLLLYFAISVILQFFPAFDPYKPLLTWAGLLALAVTLWMGNQSNMQHETLSGDREPAIASPVLWNNRLLIGLLFGLTVVVVLFRKLQQGFHWLKEQLLSLISWLLNRPSKPLEGEPLVKPPQQPSGLPGPGEPSLWLQWLEKIAFVVVGMVLCLAALYLLYKTLRKLWSSLRSLFHWLTSWLSKVGKQKHETGYEDAVESLVNWQMWNETLASRWKHWLEAQSERRVRWEDLTDNRERVRYLYKLLIHRAVKDGYVSKAYLTPGETIQDLKSWKRQQQDEHETLLDLYEKVRYGDKQVESSEVLSAKKEVESKK